jgi:hypothetical protein
MSAQHAAPPLTPAPGEADADLRSDGQIGPDSRSDESQKPVQSDGLRRPCRYRTRAGAACPFPGSFEDGGCASHSQTPDALAERRSRSAKGGHGRSNLARAARIVAAGPFAGVADTITKAIAECYSGELDPARGHAIAALSRSVVAVSDAANIGDRLAELEAEVATLARGETAGEVFTPAPRGGHP